MTTYTEARDVVVTYLVTEIADKLPGYKVVWDPVEKVDINTVGNQFIQVGVDFEDAAAATLDGEGSDVVGGYIGFRIFVKDGADIRQIQVIFDVLRTMLSRKKLGAVHTLVPKPGQKVQKSGWTSWDFGVDLIFYTLN